jgi:hypothetical protein
LKDDRFNTPTVPLGEAQTAVEAPARPARSSRRSISVFDPPADRFEEAAELGRGGMGRVVEARDRALDRSVAIKHLHATNDTDLARFEREVRITARLEHPSIVPILDAGRDDEGRPFYVMRKIEGEPLSKRVTEARSPRDRLALVPSVLGAVDAAAYAHARGIVHRDIKPWNILLGAFGETLLIDWGIARELDRTDDAPSIPPPESGDNALTRAGVAYGTPGFMAPEQARGERVDRRADVYSLGATLYYVLAGKLPLGEDPTQAIARAAAGDPPSFAAMPEEVPIELTAIAKQALATDPADRYADAGELAADLRRFLAGQLVAAHDYTPAQRLVRWVRKHRLIASVIVVATAVIAVGAWISVTRIVDERDQASRARALAEQRAEELLLDRARSLVPIDPTSTLALLAKLPASSIQTDVTRAIARAAVHGGIERSIGRHTSRVSALAISRSGLVASSAPDNTIAVHDRTSSRTVAEVHCSSLAWIGETTLGCLANERDEREVVIVDVASGKLTRVPGKPLAMLAANERLFVRFADRTVAAYTRDGMATAIATDAIAIAALNDRVAIAGLDFVRVIDRDGAVRERAVALPQGAYQIAVSEDGKRVAAFTNDAMFEWNVGDQAAPRHWPRSEGRGHGIGYAGNTLYMIARDGVSELGSTVRSRWPVRGTLYPLETVVGGAIAATDRGKLALVEPAGAIEIAHRTIDLRVIALAPDRSFAVLGTIAGDVIELDLRMLRPRMFPLPPRSTALGVSRTHVVVGETIPSAQMMTRLTLVEIASGKETQLGTLGFGTMAMIEADLVIGHGGLPMERDLVIWDLAGKELRRVAKIGSSAVGNGIVSSKSIFYANQAGELYELSLVPLGEPRLLAKLALHERDDGREISTLMGLYPTNSGLFVATATPNAQKELSYVYTLYEAKGSRVMPLDPTVELAARGRTRDGTAWFVEEFRRLWRLAPNAPPQHIDLGVAVEHILVRDDRVIAITKDRFIELAIDGSVLRQVTMPYERARRWTADGFATLDADGISVFTMSGSLRYKLPTSAAPTAYTIAFDGSAVAAVVGAELAVWTDPLPPVLDLRAITNAELELGSDAITWRR